MSPLHFDRRISPDYEQLINSEPMLLKFLQQPGSLSGTVTRPPTVFDVQLRRRDQVTVYAGATKLLDLHHVPGGNLVASAHKRYMDQIRSGLYGPISRSGIPSQIAAAAAALPKMRVARSFLREGAWQAWLASRAIAGQHAPWAILDRESQPEGVEGAVVQRLAAARSRWMHAAAAVLPRVPKDFSRQDVGACPDFLGVTPDGDLAVIEVKHGDAAHGIYYAPIQVGGYAALWSDLLDQAPHTVDHLNALIEQKERLGLLAPGCPKVRSGPACVPVLFVGEPNGRSTVWGREGLLNRVRQAALGQGAPLDKLQVWVAQTGGTSGPVLREITATLTP